MSPRTPAAAPSPLGLSLRSGLRGVALAAPVALAVSAALGGVRGLVSSLVGLLLVGSFFLVSMVLVERANTVGPGLTLPVALTVYGVKVVILGVIVFGTDAAKQLNGAAFAWTVVGATLAWLVSQSVAVWRTRMPYVVMDEAVSPTGAGSRSETEHVAADSEPSAAQPREM